MNKSGKSISGLELRVLFNTFSNFASKLFTLGAWFFLTPFLIRRLGETDYGLWVLVGSVVAYGWLLDFGIAGAITKYVAEYASRRHLEQAQQLISTALWLYIAIGLAAMALSAVLALVFPLLFNVPPEQQPAARWLVLLSGLGLGVALPGAAPTAVLRGLQRFDLSNLITLVGMSLYVILTVGVLLLGGGLLGMVAVNIPLTVLMQVPAIVMIRRIAPELRFGLGRPSRALVRRVTSFSSALFIINVAGQLQNKSDEVVIGISLPVASITPYSIARRLAEMPQLLTDQFMKVLLPLASQLHAEDDPARLRALYLASTRLTLVIFLPVAAGLAVLVKPFIAAWVGPEYIPYAFLVWILLAAGLVDASQWPAGLILQGMARHRLLAVVAILSGLANLALSLVLVRRFGLAGVAFGTLLPALVENLIFILPYARREIGVSWRDTVREAFLPPLLPAIPMALTLFALNEIASPDSLPSILLVALAGAAVYAAGYLLFGARPGERESGIRLTREAVRAIRNRRHVRYPS